MVDRTPDVSVVVPTLNGAARLVRLHERLHDVLDRQRWSSEIVLVDDGSTDETWSMITSLARRDGRTRGVRLAANVGQTGALCAGFSLALGDVVVMVDDDLAEEVAELPRFVDAVHHGADFASGWRQGRRVPIRTLGSWLYNRRLSSWGLPFRDAGCGFNAMSGPLAKQLAAEGWGIRQHRLKPMVASLTGSIVEIRFPAKPTKESHFNVRSLAASWLDVELTFGRATTGGFLAVAVVAPAMFGGSLLSALLDRPPASTHSRLTRVGIGALACTCLAGAACSLEVLRVRTLQDRGSRLRPPFEVDEVTPGEETTLIPPQPSS